MVSYQGIMDTSTGTTVDNLNVLDAIKTNDTSGIEYIYWADISTFLTTSTNATQTVTIQQAFEAGQLLLTFQVGSSFYTIGYNSTASVYYQSGLPAGFFLEQTDQYGTPVSQFDPITGQTVTGSAQPLLEGFTGSLADFVTQVNNLKVNNVSLFTGTTQLITDTIDGSAGKDNIQGIASNAAIHNIIQGGSGADVLTGGIGSDYFVFAKATDSPVAGQLNSSGQLAQTWDQITNFQVGTDKIDFSQLINDQSVSSAGGVTAFAAGLAEFRWFGAQPANTSSMGSGNGYGVWYTPDGSGGVYVYADTNGDGAADLKFQVSGVTALNPSDFIAVDPPSAFTVHINPIEPTQSNPWLINLADANAGVTVTGTVAHFTPSAQLIVTLNGHNYTATVAANGTWSAVIPAGDLAHNLLPDGSYTLTAAVKVGSSTAASDSHSVSVDETPPTIAINTIAGDNRLNLAESASNLTISGTTSGVENGQTVSVVLNGHTYTGTVTNNAWSVTAPASDLAHAQLPDGSYTVTANVSDLAGNPATQATHALTVDETPPTIAINTIAGDNRLNLAESASNLTISGTTSGVENGQTVSVVLNGHTYTGTVTNNAWSVTAPASDLAHAQLPDGSYTVTANVSDLAGNPATQATHALTVDETPPTIAINTIATDDVINAAESQSALTITGTTTGVEAGQTVTVSLNGHDYSATVAANGSWSASVAQADVAALSDGGSYTVHASVSDVAGNPAAADHTIAVDESATIAINTIATDDVINAAESQSALTITGTTTGVEAGQTVTVSLNGHDYSATVAANGSWSASVAQADVAALSDGGSYTVHASVSDVAGNPAAADHTIAVDESATIAINTIATDDVINAAESQSALTITGTTTGVEAGQTVTVSLNGHDYSATVAANGSWSASVAQADVAALSDGGSYTVHASVSDVAGNPAAADHTIAVDESATIAINTIATDDVINAAESQSALTITGTTTGVEAGQTVTVSLNGHDYSATVAANGSWSASVAQADVAALSDGGSYTVHASVSDVAGNPAAADHTIAVDESATIAINTIATDDVINAAESQSALTITGTTTGVEAGQTVTVSLNGHDYSATVAANGSWSASVAQADVAALSDGGSYTVHASVSDVAGNPAAADHTIAVDESATIAINTIATDDVINAAESQSALTITGTTTGVEAGQTVTVSLNGHDYSATVAANGSWSASVAQADVAALSDGGSYTVHASVSDVAGNPAAADHTIAVDESATIAINTIATDDVINAAESQSALTITGTTTGVEAGQTVTVSLNGHDYSATVAANGSWSASVAQADVAALSDGGSYTVHASVSDVAGNPAAADHTIAVDESATIAINTIATDDVINAAESQSALTITGTTTGVEAGQTVTVSLNGHDYSATVAANGSWSASVAQADVAALSDGGSYTVHASVSDVAGNPAAADHTIAVDESATIAINTIATDDVINAAESQSALTITGTTTGVEAGQTVTVSLNGHDYSATVAANGSWSASVAQADVAALSDGGSYTVHASVSDVAGNPAAADHTIAVDESATIAINTIATDDVINAAESQSALTITGTTTGVEAGQTVTVSLNGHDYSATVAANGSWSASVAQADVAALSDGGSYTVHASVSDVAGNPAAADHTIAVDESATILAVTAIAPDNGTSGSDFITNTTTVSISGTIDVADANRTITVKDGSTTLGTATADASGNWTLANVTLAQGTHSLTASATDLAGNTGTSAAQSVTIDTTAPTAPSITSITDDVSPLTGTLTSGASTNDTDLTVKVSLIGTGAVAGDTVQLYNGSGTTSQLGTSYTLTSSDISNGFANVQTGTLTNGTTYTLTARVTDQAGNQSAVSTNSFTVTEDTTPPTAPTIVHVGDGGAIGGSDHIVSGQSGDAVVSGTAEANSTIAIFSGAAQLGTTTADGSGNWSYTLTSGNITTIGQGSGKSVTATATDAAGNTSSASSAFSFSVDTIAPTAPTIAHVGDGGAIGGSDHIVSGQSGDAVVSGTAEANSTIAIFSGAAQLGTTTADGSGNWSYTLTSGNITTIGQGSAKSVTAAATDAAGNSSSASSAFSFSVDTVAPTAPTIAHVGDGGAIGGSDHIVSGQSGDAVVSGTAEANSTIAIFSGATQLGTTTADGSGNWSYTLTSGNITTIGQGSGKSVTATATDAAGNSSSASSAFSFSVDTVAPTAPTIAHVGDGGAIGGSDHIVSGQSGDAVVSGTAEANSTIAIFSGAAQLGTTTADGSGNWSYTLTSGNITTIGQGSAKSVTAAATDAAGNSSSASSAFSFSVDTVAPTAPTIAHVGDGGAIGGSDHIVSGQSGDAVVSGTAEANSTIAIFSGATQLGTTTADGSGNWSYTLTSGNITTIGQGSGKSVTATATDAAGNTSSASSAFSFSVDTIAPTATATVTALSSDSGSSSSDFITNVASQTVSGTFTGTLGPGEKIQVSADGSTWVDATAGSSTFTASGVTLSSGTGTLSVRTIDTAGNTTAGTSHSYTLDQITPTGGTPALTAASDSGSSSTDNITKVTNPTFTVALNPTVAVGDTVQLLLGGSALAHNVTHTITSADISAGSVSLTVTAGDLGSDGSKSITAKFTDTAGNFSTTSADVITLDTTPPSTLSWSYNNGQSKLTATTDTSGVWKVTVHDNTSSADYNATLQSAGTWTLTQSGLNGDSLTVTEYDIAGNTTTSTHTAPAGQSGAPIDLGLSSTGGSIVSVSIQNLPDGWVFGGATQNGDGSWSLTTSEVGLLSVATSANYTGALALHIVESWTNTDGTIGKAIVVDNLEAYAPGSPIFAWSGDDNLTGSSAHDTFVFSQPIGNDVVHSFDVSSDVIDLISYGWQSFSDVQAHTADDASGNAVITLADGQTITLDGVHAADLSSANFEFDVTPTTENPGPMTIGDGAMLPLSGIIHNTGTIELQASGDDTLLQLIQTGITLNGGGQVVLSDDDHNIIAGTAPNVTLDNVDNVISGAGQLGEGSLTLSNEGTIDATGTHALVIDTGTNVITNAGTLEATGSGGLLIDSAIANSGQLWANGGTVTALGEVSGSGTAEISGTGTMEFGAASAANVTFDANATGHLILDDAFHFTGTVSGLTANDDIDLKGIGFGAGTTVSFTGNQAGTGGTLTVSDGVHTANIVLLGQYDPTGFNEKADATNGTVVSYDPHHIA
ncbi:Ig-like domain-containing protein [Bradyrhizobium sp. ISRA463]|uniref:Ig-like domain-containing protein n=1 Tax=unclassified Bradyrhizobium TaxID=2631580 RepID=UPI0027A58238|nr:Ig-like domain-containing protein [Bradyrhizobium sp. ISRA463]WGS26566.1 Ig-like domain-containing protein [Bradyrhizobium sp. ISRA464]